MRYSIDILKIYRGEGYELITVQGWALSDDGRAVRPVFSFQAPLRITEEKITYTERKDVYAAFAEDKTMRIAHHDDIGFQGTIKVLGNISTLTVSFLEDGLLRVGKKYSEKEVERMTAGSVIIGMIDSITYNKHAKQYSIFGWNYSIDNQPIHYTLLDQTGKEIPFESKVEARYDVAKSLGIEEAESAGYHIWFSGEQYKRYTLIAKTDTDETRYEVRVSLWKEKRIAAKNRLNAVKSFFSVYGGFDHIKQYGLKASFDRIHCIYDEGKYYDKWFQNQKAKTLTLSSEREQHFPKEPLISIVVPTYNTPERFLKEMIESVRSQSYENWELCIADASVPTHPTRGYLRAFSKLDTRIKVTYLENNLGISENTNVAIDMAKGDYIAFFDHDDFLELDALYEVVKRINETDCDLIYTDEDKYLSESKRYFMPAFKPDYSPDLLLSDNYICHWTIVKSHIAKDLKLRKAFDGSQDYDFLLRVTERTDKIEHIAKVLYHWRMSENSTAFNPESKMYCFENGKKALEEHLQNLNQKAVVTMLKPPYYGYYHVTYIPQNNPKVSIIIPNHNQKETLERCINSLQNINTYKNIEIIIVENNSTQQELFDYYKQCEANGIKVIRHDQPSFNYSNLNNIGVKYSMGEILLFLNNDTEVIEKDSIKEMVGLVQRESTGCVGAKLLYDNNTIQHAGVVYSKAIVAGHAFVGLDRNEPGTQYMVRPQLNSNYSAVTGACLMVRKDVFDKVNGFDESFPVAYNDVDFCLKVRELGLWNVYCAFSVFKHYESLTRGYDIDPVKAKRLKEEGQRFMTKWAKVYQTCDPFYHPSYDDAKLFQLKVTK